MNNLNTHIRNLNRWIEQNGWAGWDPYDLKETSLYLLLQNLTPSLVNKIIRIVGYNIFDFFPILTRKILNVQPCINAKAMGLFLASYANLYRVTEDKNYLKKAQQCVYWLIQNLNESYSGYSWGYPFDWKSVHFIPKWTPSSVVTATVGDGFYLLYLATKNEEYLNICDGICRFFLENLKITYEDDNAICYSYTPLDNYQIHNANLFIGEFLVRIGKVTNNNNMVNQGLRCGAFALKEQQPEGYLPYWGLSQTDSHSNGVKFTDHYHSGFEIRMLYKIWKHATKEPFQRGYLKYFQWYLKNMLLFDYLPKMTPEKLYPINIHSCAEAILCQSTLLPDHPGRLKQIQRIINWVTGNMEYLPGHYVYLIRNLPFIGEWKVKIPMIRWGQAWIFRAYSEFLINCNNIMNSTIGSGGCQCILE